MPFKCSLCELDIQVGEPMLSDEKMNLAHEACIRKATQLPKTALPSVAVMPVSSAELAKSVAFKLAHGIPVPVAEARALYAEPCVPAPKLCVECRKPAIAMCPGCHQYVHQDFGYNGSNCSGRHEGGCEGARQSRARSATPVVREVIVDTPLKSRNGKHSKKKGDR